MDISPFPYQGPLRPDQVRGRDDVVTSLVERLTERRLTALLGPRRYGKTSLLRRVAADLGTSGVSVIWADLYEVTSVADVALRLDAAISDARGPVHQHATRIAAGLDINLGVLKVNVARTRDRPDGGATLHALLDVVVRAAEETPTILVLDEFSGIARVDGVAGLLRTKLQHHYQDLGLVFAGSEPSTMRALFTDRVQPFYAQADLISLGPLSAAAVEQIVADGFATSGREPGPLAAHIVDVTGGHPQRAMQLADAAWRIAVPGAAFSAAWWDEALEVVRAASGNGCERLYSGFPRGQQSVLRIAAAGEALFGRYAELLALSTGSAQHARQALLSAGDLIEVGDRVQVTDPIFADWIRQRFPL
jgi:hypothetical protein